MPESKRPLKVFLCHASPDKPAVRNLYKQLIVDGVDAWLDAESLIPGQNWQVEIPKAISESGVVVVCLSEKSINKEGYVQKEIAFALDLALEKPEGTIFIIPARLQECKVPNRLSMYHWVDLFDENGYEKLMRALRLRADNIGATLQIKKKEFYKTSEAKSENIQTTTKRKLALKSLIGKTALAFLGITVLLTLLFSFWKPLKQNMPTPISGETKAVNEPLATSSFLSPTLDIFQSSSLTMPQEITSTSTQEVTKTPPQEATKTPTFSPVEIVDDKGVAMMLVPAGTFIMGAENRNADEQPVHIVDLSSYYIDKYEVTNTLYKTCVIMGGCTSIDSIGIKDYYEDPVYENYPAVMVGWDQASAYCEWRGARLPTEAEWEKAARGANGQIYPWGNDKNFDCSYANYYGCVGSKTQVGSYEKGKSPYGIYDMIGNVSEWVNDWYGNDYYATLGSNASDPQGPSTPSYGYTHIIRGGSFIDTGTWVRSSLRSPNLSAVHSSIGFRCAKDAP